MKVTSRIFCSLLLSLLVSSIEAPLEAEASSIMSYLQSLEEQGKERVVVEFYASLEPSLIEEYGGTVIRSFKTINGLLCEIPKASVELLKRESTVKEIAPDMVIELESAEDRTPDPEDFAMMLSLKEDYLRRIKEEYDASMEKLESEYRKAYMDYYYNVTPYLRSYNRYMRWYQTLSNVRLKELVYQRLILRYRAIINQLEAAFKETYQIYKDRIKAIEESYVRASSEEAWREELSEIRLFNYPGPVTVRWNNLEQGLNSKAAWDRYNLSGEGVKIAFLDSGVNYTLPDLRDNYLGGIDYVGGDDDPISTNPDEWHGTEVVSLAVAKGKSKVVGVSYNAGFYVARIFDQKELGFGSDALSGIEWASERADIISMSFGLKEDVPYWKPKFEKACNDAYEAGVILVAGSGNSGYSYSAYPAAFENVISVGMYAENQVIPLNSNGGVDVVAPGRGVYVIDPLNNLYLDLGTSMATPHVSGLIALQMEYARKNNIDYNNGYHWEVMKHAAVDLKVSEPWQGKGKAWAAGDGLEFLKGKTIHKEILRKMGDVQTGYGTVVSVFNPDATSRFGRIKLGSLDLMELDWPLSRIFKYPNSVLYEDLPSFSIGDTFYQDTLLANTTFCLGNETRIIEEIDIATTQVNIDSDDELPEDSREEFFLLEPLEVRPGLVYIFEDDYYIPDEATPGENRTELELEFTLDEDDRILKIKDPQATTWFLN